MNSAGYHEMKKFLKENDTQFNRKKFMLTIVWNPRGFHLIKVLEKRRKFNTGCYIAEILEPLSHCPKGTQLKKMLSIRCVSIRSPFQMKSKKEICNLKSIPNKEFEYDEEL
jgi:hypothetical protein